MNLDGNGMDTILFLWSGGHLDEMLIERSRILSRPVFQMFLTTNSLEHSTEYPVDYMLVFQDSRQGIGSDQCPGTLGRQEFVSRAYSA